MFNWKSYIGLGRRAGKPVRNRKYLYTLIWLSCISVCVPVILASVVYHYISVGRMQEYLAAESESALILTKDRAERVLQGIELESLQLAKEPLVSLLADYPFHSKSLDWHMELLDKLALVKNSSGFISELFVYLRGEDLVLSNDYGVIAKPDYKYRNDIDRLMDSGMLTQWARLPGGSGDGYITFARLLPSSGGDKPLGVIVFEIEASSFSAFLEEDTVVLTRGAELIILTYRDLFQPGEQLSDDQSVLRVAALDGIDRIVAAEENAGRFVAPGIDGNPAQFQFVKNVFSRTYVSVIPERTITRELDWIRGATILILLTFAGIGIMLTVFTARRAYSPIEQLIQHSRSLNVGRVPDKENEIGFIKACLDYLSKEKENLSLFMEKIEPSLREKCLQQLFGGEYARHETLLEDCARYGIDTELTNVVLIAEAENLYREKRFMPEEKGVVAFALANVMQEILRGHAGLQGHVIPYQGAGVAIVQFRPETEQAEMHRMTAEYAELVTQALDQYLSFKATIGVGRYYAHIADVPVSYKEAQIALQHRIFQDAAQILFIEEIEDEKKQPILRYPRELEAHIVEALERDDTALAAEQFRKFAELLKGTGSYAFIQQSYHILLSALIVSLERQNVSMMDIMEANLFDQLRSKRTFAELLAWFEETVFPLYGRLTQSAREAQGESGIPFICKYIRDNCGQDLSLVQCAELAGISPSYLSRLFKKEMGMNFLEYVVECKIAEAKRLLRETDSSISEIALAVGYSERNLNRIFQRSVQLSPGSYRAQYR